MNEPRQHLNKSDFEDRMTTKDLKEMKVTTYINKVHFHFWWLNHRNSMVKHALFAAILCWVTS